MELIHPNIPHGNLRVAIFDFDGTLSLLREGWQQTMIQMMVDVLTQTPAPESEAVLRRIVTDLVYRTTGQQTIYQMMALCAEVEKRGGHPAAPQVYKQLFSERLLARVNARVAALKSGATAPEAWLVPGTLPLLGALRARGITCYIASGTDEVFVRDEAAWLGLLAYFTEIYGANADYKHFSKKKIVERIVKAHGLHRGELVTFGDGRAEIEDTKAVSGIAVGVATDEVARSGVDARKRAQLLDAGADIIIPDFREYAALVALLFPEEKNGLPNL